jgi:hypothetical protein
MSMPRFDIGQYNRLSAAFTYAHVLKGDPQASGGASVVRLQDGAQISCSYSTKDAPRGLFNPSSRSADEMAKNNATRTVFRNAVISIFGTSINDVPKNVRSAMCLSDYDCGKPLTARRIIAVNKAIDSHLKNFAKSIGITGGSATEIVAAIAKGTTLFGVAGAEGDFKARANRNATSLLATGIASQAKNGVGNAFDADLGRGMGLTVGGKRVNGRNPAVARDKITQLLTGDRRATFEAADEATKRKVKLLTSMMHQGTFASMLVGVNHAFDPNSKQLNFSIMEVDADNGGMQANSFSLSIDRDGNITIKGKLSYTNRMYVTVPGIGFAPKAVGDDGSYAKYECTITIPANNLNQLADADWDACDLTDATATEHDLNIEDRFVKAANKIPQGYKFEGNVDVKMNIRINDVRDGFDY